MSERILIIEDNADLAANLFEYLEPKGFVLDHAPDGITGLHLAVTQAYDVIILDLMLPGIDGISLCKRLRVETGRAIPVLMLTARDQLSDKLEGFSSGADDYLVKPFEMAELLARVRALILGRQGDSQDLRVGPLLFDLGRRRIERQGKPVKLTHAGERLLETLMRAYPNAVRQSDLEHALWGDDLPERTTLRTHIHAIRRGIDVGFEHKMLKTIHRYGYQLVCESDA